MKQIQFILLIIGIVFMLFPFPLSAQGITFEYDAAGNRISRRVITLRSVQASEPEEEPEVYSEKLSTSQISIYPNPTEGLLKIDLYGLESDQTAQLNLYDLSGKLVTSQQAATSFSEIYFMDQPKGMYILKIVIDEEESEWKIIKK